MSSRERVGKEGQDTKCDICGGDHSVFAPDFKSPLGGQWSIHECEDCGARFVHPIPSNEQIDYFYDALYQGGSASRTDSLDDASVNGAYWRRQWKLIRGLTGNNEGRVLDFGCGGGHFLDAAGEGWDKHGVELSEHARETARRKGITVYRNLWQEKLPQCSFDVVSMFATIEHLPNPREEVEELAGTLKSGGLFVVMTGDTRSLKAKLLGNGWHMYRPPEHLFFFCARSLDRLMSSIGFRKVSMFYTDGGMTQIPFGLLNRLLRKGLAVFERVPVIQTWAIFDHNYSYYVKE
jgi:SAM-dependent methyltransferase